MLIGELAEATGLSRDAIRYYEKLGLLGQAPVDREINNYRHFDESAVDTILFIKHGKALGLTLKEIKKFIHEWSNLKPDEIAAYIDQKIAELDNKIAELEAFKQHLAEKRARLAEVDS